MTNIVANVATGEVWEQLDKVAPEELAQALEELHERQAQFKHWQSEIEAELRRRLRAVDRKLAVFGPYEVAMTTPRKSEWDAELLEIEIASLVAQGVLKAAEVTEVIDRTPTVRAGEAAKLVNRLSGDPKRALESARTWKDQTGKLTVVRSVQLPTTAERGSLTPLPDAPPEPAGPAQLSRGTADLFERPLQTGAK